MKEKYAELSGVEHLLWLSETICKAFQIVRAAEIGQRSAKITSSHTFDGLMGIDF